VARHVDDVVSARHDVHVTVLVDVARVARVVVAGNGLEVRLVKPLGAVVQREQRARREGQLDRDVAQRVGGHLLVAVVEDLHVVSGAGGECGAVLHGNVAVHADKVRADGPSCLRLPPMVADRDVERGFRPFQ
jgi:hypothetical protein